MPQIICRLMDSDEKKKISKCIEHTYSPQNCVLVFHRPANNELTPWPLRRFDQ